jgi:hypothetical protein
LIIALGQKMIHLSQKQLALLKNESKLEAKAFSKFDGTTVREQLAWIVAFTKRSDLGTPDQRVTLGYEVRALAAVIGIGWSWRRRPGPLTDKALMKIQRALKNGLAKLRKSAVAGPADVFTKRLGWALPEHRTRLARFPVQIGGDEKSAIYGVKEAANEPSAIVASIGEFLLRHAPRWKICECGCGAPFVASRNDQRYLEECGNKLRQRRWYAKHCAKARQHE